MMPLPPQQVAERIRKARSHRDRRLNHSEDYYLWLGYNVFITNVDADTLSAAEIMQAYKVRWQIEILFKTWKSGLHLQKILDQQCENIYRIKTTIYLLLMLFCLIMQKVYMPYCNKIKKEYGKELSLMKLIIYITNNLIQTICSPPGRLKEQLAKHCCYESRNDRTNMAEFMNNF